MKATLIYDVRARAPFGGSCGLVTYFFRKAFSKLGYRTRDVYIPTSNKSSIVNSPRTTEKRDIIFCVEEIFPRLSSVVESNSPINIAFFNLAYFEKINAYKDAHGVLFNSQFLMNCFLAENYAKNLIPPPVDWMPMPIGIREFPKGYPSNGYDLKKNNFFELKKEYFVGHAVRQGKQDYFATLSIVNHLNIIAKQKGIKPFCLLINEKDYAIYQKWVNRYGFKDAIMDYFYPVPDLQNKAMLTVMRNSDFALCYDDILEAFGYYVVETIYCGCPLFTNGVGNLRYVVPRDHGIYRYETLDMYFGNENSRQQAYLPVAKNIVNRVSSRDFKKAVGKGKKYIQRKYNETSLKSRLKKFIHSLEQGNILTLNRKSRFTAIKSPYLRLADWENGLFVTDHGLISNIHMGRKCEEALQKRQFADELVPRLDVRIIARSTDK